MMLVRSVVEFLQRLAPLELAQDWDNVGLLLGSLEYPIKRVMTCLTLSGEVAQEAIDRGAHLVVVHHPLPFRPLQRITDESPAGEVLWLLARSGVCIYSAHTAWDDAPGGINDQLAQALGLERLQALVPGAEGDPARGTGRVGQLPTPMEVAQVAQRVKQVLGVQRLQGVGATDRRVQRVGIVCGSGGGLLAQAVQSGCELFLTGELRFHAAVEAAARGLSVILPGHYATERFAMEQLAAKLADEFPQLEVWASSQERDPLQWM